MFDRCEKFNQDLSRWNVSKVTDMAVMFRGCKNFNQDLSRWDVSKVKNINYMFDDCPIKEEFKPKFKK
jgi:surface protein